MIGFEIIQLQIGEKILSPPQVLVWLRARRIVLTRLEVDQPIVFQPFRSTSSRANLLLV